MNEINDKAFTIRLSPDKKMHGRFKEGNIPWNKGMSWTEQGVTPEEREIRLRKLQEGNLKRERSHKPTHSKPVIQMDEDGNRLHWYASSEAAARKIGRAGRNIRKVCDGQKKSCGGFYWKWDERFLN